MALEYFTLAEFRALPQMSDDVRYTDERVDVAAAYIVGIIEREVETSFVARSVVDVLDGNDTARLKLSTPYALEVTGLTVDDVVVDFSEMKLRRGVLYRPTGTFTCGVANVEVTYDAGYSTTVPGDVKEAAMKGTRAHLLSTNSNALFDDRRTSMTTDQGTVGFVVAGEDRPTGYPEVDAVILGWKRRLNTVTYP